MLLCLAVCPGAARGGTAGVRAARNPGPLTAPRPSHRDVQRSDAGRRGPAGIQNAPTGVPSGAKRCTASPNAFFTAADHAGSAPVEGFSELGVGTVKQPLQAGAALGPGGADEGCLHALVARHSVCRSAAWSCLVCSCWRGRAAQWQWAEGLKLCKHGLLGAAQTHPGFKRRFRRTTARCLRFPRHSLASRHFCHGKQLATGKGLHFVPLWLSLQTTLPPFALRPH